MLCIKFPLGICTKWPISIIHYICSFDTIEVWKVRTKMATEGYINLKVCGFSTKFLVLFSPNYVSTTVLGWCKLPTNTIHHYTIHHTPLHHTPCTITPYTLHLCTIHLTLYTIHHSPFYLHDPKLPIMQLNFKKILRLLLFFMFTIRKNLKKKELRFQPMKWCTSLFTSFRIARYTFTPFLKHHYTLPPTP